MTSKAKLVIGSILLVLVLLLLLLWFFRGGAPVPSREPGGQAVLNEVLFSSAQDQFQFVELKGTAGDGSVEGWKLSNEKGETFPLPPTTPRIGPGEFLLVVFDGENRVEGRTVRADRREFLNRVSGSVELVDGGGRSLDRVAWGVGQAGGVNLGRGGVHEDLVAGTSLGRHPRSVKAGDFLEWLTFQGKEMTPGTQNPNPRVEVLLPIDGAFFPRPSIELSWYPVAGAGSYRVQIAADAEFSRVVEDRVVQTPSFATPALAAGDYLWRVQAVFAGDSTAEYSPASSFTISTTELPAAPAPSSGSLISDAHAADLVPPRREGVLAVPMIYQHKDTAMLLLESQNESGTHAWDRDHGALDQGDPADNMNCALASTVMVNRFAGGNLSQDRIGYELRKADVADNPAWDLNYGRGLQLDQINQVLTFAFNGAAVARHTPTTADAFWAMVTREIDAQRPIVIRVPNHAVVIAGYYQFSLTGPNARFVTINDPWSGRHLVNLSRMRRVTHYWLVADTSNPRNDEATLTQDSDGDGIVDFDELERFKTLPGDRDSDHDKVADKTEVYASVFDPDDGYAALGTYSFTRDRDGDRKFMESDPDSDGGGCKDGEEDKNANGKRDSGETSNFDEDDDKCEAGPLGGRVKMTYAYSASRRATCVGRVEINTRFTLHPVISPQAPNIVHTYRADALTYDIRTDGCADYPGDDLVYTFDEGIHLSGTIPLTEQNLGFVMFFPAFPQFSMQLPADITYLNDVNRMTGRYTTSDGTTFPAETSVVYEALAIESNPSNCASGSTWAQPEMLDFCTEPTPCADSPRAPAECFTEPQRYYMLPFRKSFHWDTPENEPGEQYHIGDVDVTVEICEGCGEE